MSLSAVVEKAPVASADRGPSLFSGGVRTRPPMNLQMTRRDCRFVRGAIRLRW